MTNTKLCLAAALCLSALPAYAQLTMLGAGPALPHRSSCFAGNAYADGCANAPAGVPQMATAFSSYSVRPPWNVAGVDYHVGIPANTTLLDPATASLPSGATYNGTNHTLTLASPGGTISGFDFSLHGGTELLRTASPWTVQNSYFKLSTNMGTLNGSTCSGACGTMINATGAGDLVLLNNEYDGSDIAVTAQVGVFLGWSGVGTLTIKYGYMHDTGGDFFNDLGGGPANFVLQYNLASLVGVNTGHSDLFAWYNANVSGSGVPGVLAEFNTVYNTPTSNTFIGNGLLTIASGHSVSDTLAGGMMRNNTVLAPSGIENWIFGIEDDFAASITQPLIMHNNWGDATASINYTGNWLLPNRYLSAYFGAGAVISNNWDIKNNRLFDQTSYNPPYLVVPDLAGVTPVTSDVYSITASPASGNVTTGNTITFTLALDDNYTVTGSPTLSLSGGKTAVYTSGSGTKSLVFTYTVGVEIQAGVSVTAVNGTIKDVVGNPLNGGGALTSFGSLTTNASAPAYADGASGAPACTPPFPSLLNGYAKRPPWSVAGVDYCVGIPDGTTLKDPATMTLTGTSVTGTFVRVTGDNVVLDGWDFSLAGGYQLYITGNNVTIRNSLISNNTTGNMPINIVGGSVGATIRYNTFNGALSTGVWREIGTSASGNTVIEYNLFVNIPDDGIDQAGGPTNWTVRYNMFYNLGAAVGTTGGHPDAMQYEGTVNPGLIAFNTLYQPPAGSCNCIASLQYGATMSNVRAMNNVLIGQNYTINQSQDAGGLDDLFVISNNYIDNTGGFGPYALSGANTNLTYSGDWNMVTGTKYSPPGGATFTSDVSSVTPLPSSGTRTLGQTVTITLGMDQAYTITGTPTLSLNNGGTASYTSGSGTASLVFTYTVAASQTTATLAVTAANLPGGAKIIDALGNAANTAGAIVSFSGLGVSS